MTQTNDSNEEKEGQADEEKERVPSEESQPEKSAERSSESESKSRLGPKLSRRAAILGGGSAAFLGGLATEPSDLVELGDAVVSPPSNGGAQETARDPREIWRAQHREQISIYQIGQKLLGTQLTVQTFK